MTIEEQAKEIEKLQAENKELVGIIRNKKIAIAHYEGIIRNDRALFKQLLKDWIKDLSISGSNTKKKVREEMKKQLKDLKENKLWN